MPGRWWRRRAPAWAARLAAGPALVLAALILAAPAAGQSGEGGGLVASAPPVLLSADSLLLADRVEETLAVLEAHLAQAPDDFAARWRAARAAVFLGFLASGTEEENRWFRRGAEHSELALRARPDDPETLRWALAAKGSLAVQTGMFESARLGREVWTLARRALELNPENADAHYTLGKLQYELLKLNRAQRLMARPFRGSDLAHASWPEALAYAQRAVDLDSGNQLYRLGLADTLWRMGRHDEASAQLEVARDLPLRTAVDRDFRDRAELLLWRIEHGIDPTR